MVDDTPPHAGDWRIGDAVAVRAVAAVLIANSHLEAFYPRSWMAGDGLSGNALFYFLSGFGVALAGGSRRRGFWPWYARRAVRLYPAVILSVLVVQVGLTGRWRDWTPVEAFRVFVYPTTYGYVGHIMLVYAGLYWLLRVPTRWPLAITAGVAAAGCVTAYAAFAGRMTPGEPLALGQTSGSLHWCYFTAVALAGAWFGPATRRPRGTLGRDAALLGGLFAAYVGLKFAMVRGHGSRAFLVLHVLVAVMCPVAVRVSADDGLQRWLGRVRPLGWAVSLLAVATLEMYVVQTWTHVWPALIALRFPLNLAGFWAATVAGAMVLRACTGAIVRAAYGRGSPTPVPGGVSRPA